jgi:beta-glucosidase
MPAVSVQAPGTRDENGPQGLTAALIASDKTQMKATAFTSEDVMAATFNTELMYDVGRVIGNNCLSSDIACLYGPGANTHRTPYGGRNFEYYSEDGFLAGEIGGAEVKGLQDKGVDVVMKHFALNDCEQDRLGQAAWINEQAAREIYLKGFQKSLEESGGNGVMTAYTRWGTTWSGGNKGLMTGIMRGEWGNQGMSITDNILVTYTNGVDGVMAGGVTTYDAMLWYITAQLPEYENDPVVVSAMREACHHNLYALANSSGMNGVGPNTTIKLVELKVITILRIVSILAIVIHIVAVVMWVRGKLALKKTEEYAAWRAFKKK